MNFKELVPKIAEVLNAEYTLNEKENSCIFNLVFFDETIEKVKLHQDFYDNSELKKEIIILECFAGKYDEESDLDFISKSNKDLFFSRAYPLEEDNLVVIEGCLFLENSSPEQIGLVIEEIAEHSSYLKEQAGIFN